MLASAFLHPLRLCRDDLPALVYESFALTYLAGYNSATISSRVRTSFDRAYGFTTLKTFQRVDGGRPGFTLAIVREPGYARIVVAIEGTQSLEQLNLMASGHTSVDLGPTGARVWGTAKTYADQIQTLVAADTDVAALAPLVMPVDEIWTGFSLGAQIAEINAKRRAALLTDNRRYRAIKFASPRVGNTAWVRYMPGEYWDSNWYYGRDLIDAIPSGTFHNSENFIGRLVGDCTFYAGNQRQTRLNLQGEEIASPMGFETNRVLFAYGDLLNRNSSSSSWYDHTMDWYRIALMAYANRTQNEAWARFLFLDYENQNAVGQNFMAGRRIPEFLSGLDDPAPPDYEFFSNVGGGSFGVDSVGGTTYDLSVPQVAAIRLGTPMPVRTEVEIAPPVERPRTNWRARRVRDLGR